MEDARPRARVQVLPRRVYRQHIYKGVGQTFIKGDPCQAAVRALEDAGTGSPGINNVWVAGVNRQRVDEVKGVVGGQAVTRVLPVRAAIRRLEDVARGPEVNRVRIMWVDCRRPKTVRAVA